MDSLSLSAKYSRSFNDPSTTEIPEVSQSVEHSPEHPDSPEPLPGTDRSFDHILSEIQRKSVGRRRKRSPRDGKYSAWSSSTQKKASRSRPASSKNLMLSPLLSSPGESVNKLSKVTSSSAVSSLYRVITARMQASGQQTLSPSDLQDIKAFFESEQAQFEAVLSAQVETRPLPPYEVHKREKNKMRNSETQQKHEEIKEKRHRETLKLAQKSARMMKTSVEDRLALHILQMGRKLERQRKWESSQANREQLSKSHSEKAIILSNIRNFYKDRIEIWKEKIAEERAKSRILDAERKQVVTRQTLVRAEQERREARKSFLASTRSALEFQASQLQSSSLNQSRLERELIRMYKRS